MKTKDLIAALLSEDPGEDGMGGELEVCVDNVDIQWVGVEPAYYDGCLQVLERRPDTKYYNIIGAKYFQTGFKVVIHPLSITDAVFNNNNLPVDMSDLDEGRRQRYGEYLEIRRQECRKIEHDCELKLFTRHILSRIREENNTEKNNTDVNENEIEPLITLFFDAHFQRNTPFPDDLRDRTKYNYGTARNLQWRREVDIVMDDGNFVLKKVTL